MKLILCYVLSCLMMIGCAISPVSAAEIRNFQSFSLNEDLSNNSDTQITLLNAEDFIQVIINDENISMEEKNYLIQEVRTDQNQRSSIYKYLTMKFTVDVTSSYKCYPYFYIKCEYYSETDVVPYRMLAIMYGNIDRNYNGISKQFSGDLYYHLESGNTYFWDLNGDFYNNGTTTYGGNIKVEIDEQTTVQFSVSNSSSWYAYKQYSKTYYSAAMNP